MCYVVLDGEEQIYVNGSFSAAFYSEEECNRRLRVEGQSPIRNIMARYSTHDDGGEGRSALSSSACCPCCAPFGFFRFFFCAV